MIKTVYPHLGETVWKGTTSQGLSVRVVPKPGFSKTYAFLAVNYGSMDSRFSVGHSFYETPQGVAHYLEHKMFDMPDGNAMQMFSEIGGSPNAFTSYDITAYYVECSDHAEENIRLLLKFVNTPWFTADSVEKERGIIAQEIRMYEDSPDSCVSDHLYEAAFRFHPIRNPIAGTVESIAQITEQTLGDCYRNFYTPDNMMFCVVGDVEPEMVFDLAEEAVTRGSSTPQRDYGPAEQMTPFQKQIQARMEVSMPSFAIGFKTEPACYGPDSMRQEFLGDLAAELLMGESSPLYSRMYEANLIDSSFDCGYEGLKGASLLTASGDGENPEAVLHTILDEAEKIRGKGLDAELFEQLKRSTLGRRIRGLDSFESICYRVCAYYFEGVDYFTFPDLFRQITLDQVAEFLDRTVQEERAVLSVIWPKEP